MHDEVLVKTNIKGSSDMDPKFRIQLSVLIRKHMKLAGMARGILT
jgi:hypothetical protein